MKHDEVTSSSLIPEDSYLLNRSKVLQRQREESSNNGRDKIRRFEAVYKA